MLKRILIFLALIGAFGCSSETSTQNGANDEEKENAGTREPEKTPLTNDGGIGIEPRFLVGPQILKIDQLPDKVVLKMDKPIVNIKLRNPGEILGAHKTSKDGLEVEFPFINKPRGDFVFDSFLYIEEIKGRDGSSNRFSVPLKLDFKSPKLVKLIAAQNKIVVRFNEVVNPKVLHFAIDDIPINNFVLIDDRTVSVLLEGELKEKVQKGSHALVINNLEDQFGNTGKK